MKTKDPDPELNPKSTFRVQFYFEKLCYLSEIHFFLSEKNAEDNVLLHRLVVTNSINNMEVLYKLCF